MSDTIKIKLGERYKTGEAIPEGEWHYFKCANGSEVLRRNTYATDTNGSRDYYSVPKIEFVLPKEPKGGEVWSAKIICGDSSRVIYGTITEYGDLFTSDKIYSSKAKDFEFIRRWEPRDED